MASNTDAGSLRPETSKNDAAAPIVPRLHRAAADPDRLQPAREIPRFNRAYKNPVSIPSEPEVIIDRRLQVERPAFSWVRVLFACQSGRWSNAYWITFGWNETESVYFLRSAAGIFVFWAVRD